LKAGDVKSRGVFASGKGVLGLVLLVVAALLHAFALAHADLTLLSCNALIGIIFNVVISTRYLGESFNPRLDLPGLSLIGFGCTVIVLLSNKEKRDISK